MTKIHKNERREGRTLYFAKFGPQLGTFLSEASCESPQISDDTGRDKNISGQIVIRVLQVVCCFRPSE